MRDTLYAEAVRATVHVAGQKLHCRICNYVVRRHARIALSPRMEELQRKTRWNKIAHEIALQPEPARFPTTRKATLALGIDVKYARNGYALLPHRTITLTWRLLTGPCVHS